MLRNKTIIRNYLQLQPTWGVLLLRPWWAAFDKRPVCVEFVVKQAKVSFEYFGFPMSLSFRIHLSPSLYKGRNWHLHWTTRFDNDSPNAQALASQHAARIIFTVSTFLNLRNFSGLHHSVACPKHMSIADHKYESSIYYYWRNIFSITHVASTYFVGLRRWYLMVSAIFCCFFCISVAVSVCCMSVYIEYHILIVCGILPQMNMQIFCSGPSAYKSSIYDLPSVWENNFHINTLTYIYKKRAKSRFSVL